MTRLQKYRRFVFALLLCSLAGLGICSYLFLKDQVPDHILVEEGTEVPLLMRFPYNSIIEEEAVEVGSRGSSDIPEGKLNLYRGSSVSENAQGNGLLGGGRNSSEQQLAIQCSLFGVIPLKTVEVEAVQRQSLYAGGTPVGIYIQTEGVLVIGTGEVDGLDGQTYQPAEHIVKSGDYIIEVNGQALSSKEELVECIQSSGGKEIHLEILRDGTLTDLAVTPVQTGAKEYKAGIWVRNDAQGVGTLTYVDEEGNFGALGHGISDVDTSTLLSLKEGSLYEADVIAVKKGESGTPGELTGVIHYRDNAILGDITSNTIAGIYGKASGSSLMEGAREYEIGYKQEVEAGPATILCTVDGEATEYEIKIESIDLNKKEVNKGMVVRVTDEELLDKTGGIVQGMSGSPIIQNGRIVGAVTHVFVNDPTKGYGIFIENMLEAAE